MIAAIAKFKHFIIAVHYAGNNKPRYCFDVGSIARLFAINNIYSIIGDYSKDELITVKHRTKEIYTDYLTIYGICRLAATNNDKLYSDFKDWAIGEVEKCYI
jgi:hypothetical protein